jgi:hypothetical protein
VLFHDDDGDHLESWSATCEKAEVEARYRHWHPSYQRIFDADTTWYKWPLFDREPIAQWTRGRVTLLGDAAHPMLPYLGQGAAQSLEDGFILAAAVDAHRDDPGLALDAASPTESPAPSGLIENAASMPAVWPWRWGGGDTYRRRLSDRALLRVIAGSAPEGLRCRLLSVNLQPTAGCCRRPPVEAPRRIDAVPGQN